MHDIPHDWPPCIFFPLLARSWSRSPGLEWYRIRINARRNRLDWRQSSAGENIANHLLLISSLRIRICLCECTTRRYGRHRNAEGKPSHEMLADTLNWAESHSLHLVAPVIFYGTRAPLQAHANSSTADRCGTHSQRPASNAARFRVSRRAAQRDPDWGGRPKRDTMQASIRPCFSATEQVHRIAGRRFGRMPRHHEQHEVPMHSSRPERSLAPQTPVTHSPNNCRPTRY